MRPKRIAILVLMMLIGGYGAVHAQGEMTAEEATEAESTKDFLGLKWGAGIGVIGGFGGEVAVEKVSLVGTDKIVRVDEEGDLRPQLFLEMHVFLRSRPFAKEDKVKKWRKYQDDMANWRETARVASPVPPRPLRAEAPLMGFGPFIAVQSSDEIAIDALALGVMWGFRRDAKASNSLNVGVGLSFDPSVQVLGNGIKEGEKLPAGETAVRFKKEGRFGWALMASFTF